MRGTARAYASRNSAEISEPPVRCASVGADDIWLLCHGLVSGHPSPVQTFGASELELTPCNFQ